MGRRIRSNLTKSRSETRRAGDDGVADPKEGKERQNATEPAPKLSEAQRRLQHLEKVVASLVDANTAPLEIRDQPTPPYTDEAATKSVRTSEQSETPPTQLSNIPLNGRLEVRGVEANYSGGTHWETILADVRIISIMTIAFFTNVLHVD